MFAVLKTGGKQYKVAKNEVIIVEKLSAAAGDIIEFDQIFMISDGKIEVGVPTISGAAVHAEVIEQTKNKKVTSFVKRRRKHSSQRTRGHRQNVTVLRVKDILSSGAKSNGTKIEVGAIIIGSNPKGIQGLSTKEEIVKKPVAKSKTVKKPVVKAETIKKPVVKAETIKKPVAKAETIKKLVVKADAVKKPVVKEKTVKQPAVKDKATKIPKTKT